MLDKMKSSFKMTTVNLQAFNTIRHINSYLFKFLLIFIIIPLNIKVKCKVIIFSFLISLYIYVYITGFIQRLMT